MHNISQFSYTMQGVQLTMVNNTIILAGILLDHKLYFGIHAHIEEICSKANHLLGILKGTYPSITAGKPSGNTIVGN